MSTSKTFFVNPRKQTILEENTVMDPIKGDKISFAQMDDLIKEIPYIQNCCSNKDRDKESLSYLIDRDLSQSDCIKLGHAVEQYFTACVSKFTSLSNVRPKNEKGKKERDILFKDDDRKIMYYTEVKTNLNLDTEKSKTTYEKCLLISEEYQLEDYDIEWCLLGARYTHSKEMPKKISKKYSSIKDNLFGVNEFLEMFSINTSFTDQTYKTLLNNIANSCFNSNSS